MTFPTNIRASDIPRKSADRQQNLRALIIEDDAGLDDLRNLRSAGQCIAFAIALAVDHHPAFGMVRIIDRNSVVKGKSVSVRIDIGGRRNINKKTNLWTRVLKI